MASNNMPAFAQLQLTHSALFPGLNMSNTLATLGSLAKASKQLKLLNTSNPLMNHHQNAQANLGHWTVGDPINLALNQQQCMQMQMQMQEQPRAVKSREKKSKKAANHQHHSGCQCCDVNEKPHLCDFPGCGKRFRQKPHLQAHKNIHSGRRFNCLWVGCGKSFVRKYNLVEHQKMHNPVQTNMCTYPECGKVFSSKYSLTRHQTATHQKLLNSLVI